MTKIVITDVELEILPVVGPRPPLELGKNLNTIEDARKWLSHPSNWIKSQLFIIKWDGEVPYIEETRARKLEEDDSVLLSVVRHQKFLKERGMLHDEVYELKETDDGSA